jgi:hypothetical protein
MTIEVRRHQTLRFVYRVVLACVSSAAALVSSQATAQAPNAAPVPRSYFGLSVMRDRATPPFDYGTTRTWDAWPRADWDQMNPSPGVYDFANLDKYLSVNHNQTRDVIYTLGKTPRWASSQPDTTNGLPPGLCAPPANLQYWDDYLKAIVTHAAGRIKYWEIWNEPNLPMYYCGDIPTLVQLAQHAQRVIKSIDPTAMILSPSATNEYGVPYLSSFLAQGGGSAIDIVAFHGYRTQKAEDIIPLVSHYKAAMAKNGVSKLPLWDTEADNKMAQTPEQESAFLAKYFMLQWSIGVSRFLWYAYDGDPQWGRLFNPYNNQPLPTSTTYVEVYKWMVGATLMKPCSQDASGNWFCVFSRRGKVSEALWNSEAMTSVSVPSQFDRYRDLYGGTHPVKGGTVSVGNEPILLTGP